MNTDLDEHTWVIGIVMSCIVEEEIGCIFDDT